jgi:hypothetical protein
MRLAMVCVLCATAMVGGIPQGITGVWSGSFNENFPETATRFRLFLRLRDGKLNGVLTVLSDPKITTPISNAECDSEGCGFEVIDNADGEVYTWRVEPHGTRLIGNRNCGHMTPLGIGVCARLFGVRGKKISK